MSGEGLGYVVSGLFEGLAVFCGVLGEVSIIQGFFRKLGPTI